MAGLALLIWLVLIIAAVILTAVIGTRWLARLLQEIDFWPEPSPGPAGPPTCPGCSYSLYYATDRRCPECGRHFDVKEVDMRLAEWDGNILRPREPQNMDQQARS